MLHPWVGKDSVILIDEIVLPGTSVDANVASIDLTMMCASVGEERTEPHWIELLDIVDLKLVKRFIHKPSAYESVMAVLPKQDGRWRPPMSHQAISY